jgi:hypothetical protein
MYLDFYEHDYEKEVKDIQFFYMLQTGEDELPNNLLRRIHKNYTNEMARVCRLKEEEKEYIIDEDYEIKI